MSTILLEIILVMIWPLSFGKTFYDFEVVFVSYDKFKMTHVEIGLWVGLPKAKPYMTEPLEISRVSTILLVMMLVMIWPLRGLWVV